MMDVGACRSRRAMDGQWNTAAGGVAGRARTLMEMYMRRKVRNTLGFDLGRRAFLALVAFSRAH